MLITSVAGHLASNPLITLAAFQAQDSINSGNSKLLMFFVGMAAVALLAVAATVVVIGVALLKLRQDLMAHFIEIKGKTMPLIASSHSLVNDLTPQIKEIAAKVNVISGHIEGITAHAEQIAELAKEKAHEFSPTISAANQTVNEANNTVRDANQKARAQVGRVNGMVTSALDATVRLGVAIEKGISVPGREIAGVVSGLKVGLDTLLSGARAFGSGAPIGRRTVPPRPVASYRSATPPVQTSAEKPDLGL